MNDASLQDFDILGTVLIRYKGSAACVTVPTGVTVIGPQAFADKPMLRSVELPNTVTAIRDKAFLNCPALEYVTIPQSVTALGQLLFLGSVQSAVYTPDGSAASRYARDRRMKTKPKPLPLPTPSELGIPANWDPKGHPLLANRQQGYLRQLRGRILITVYLVTDTECSWKEADAAAYRRIHDQVIAELEHEAIRRDIPLRIHTVYKRLQTTTKCTYAYWKRWHTRWAPHFPPDSAPGYDGKPVILALNKHLGGFAAIDNTNKTALSIIGHHYNGFESRTIRHELFHNFGAPDLYKPPAVQALAERYLPDSIMNDGDLIDALTAYCIGWTDTPSPELLAFLWETRNMKL